ncbi:MAG: FHA domain-containing protein [Acidobacteria bacterium]|nr:FHA domain-containing protein [Acidobacteriota bacterium]
MAGAVKVPSGVTIWNAMRDELLMNVYQLPFTTLPPTIYHVYLHPNDFERIEGIIPRIVSELQKALTEEVRKMNEGRARAGGMLSRLIEQPEASPVELPPAGWDVHLHADRNDELKPGDLGIESMLPLPAPVEFGGPPTTRIVRSVVTGTGRSSTTIEVQQPAPLPRVAGDLNTAERASLRYDDEQGAHVFSMRKDTLSVGRGGSSVWVDIQVVTSPRVSREHFRIRRLPSAEFLIQDFSTWGTSVNGAPLPAAAPAPDGVLRPGAERPLAPSSRIELAGVLVIHFEAGRDA